MCSANCIQPDILELHLCRPVTLSQNQGHEPCKQQLCESLLLTPSCHVLWGYTIAPAKGGSPRLCFKKLLFACSDLIFKNYEAQMFYWRKHYVKDISKGITGKG